MATQKKGVPVPSGPDPSTLFGELVKLQAAGDFEKGEKVCHKLLSLVPKDPQAFHCLIVCLVQTAKFEMALRHMEENATLAQPLGFEKAYALYRINQSEAALAALPSRTLNMREKELKAQILYRLEDYEACFSLYRDIMKNSSDDFETERLTNLSAAAVHLSRDSGIPESDSYELMYNEACHLLTLGKWLEAEKALGQSLDMAKAFLAEEDDSEEDIERETGIIRVQIGFALQMQGQEREAQVIYNQVLKNKPTDIGLVAVVSNNLLTLNKDQNIFDSKKRIKAATVEGLDLKLTRSNQMAIARNNALLAMYTNQTELCQQLVQELGKKYGIDTEDQTMILAGALSRSGKTQEAVDMLLKGHGQDLERLLVATQVYLEKNMIKEALALLTKLPKEDKFRVGILSAMVTLHLALEDRKAAAQLLKEAVAFNAKAKSKGSDMATVWRKAAEFHLKGNEPAVAVQSLEELLNTNPKDRQTLAQLVLAYAKYDLKKALETSKKLPEFRAGEVDVDALESSAFFGPKHLKKTPKSGGVASPDKRKADKDEGSDLVQKRKAKKRRKVNLPKNYNPNVEPDPERWLPKRERQGYRKKKDRRKGEKFTGAQGTAAGQSEIYDYSQKKAAGGAVPKSASTKSPAPEAPLGPRQAHKKPQQKKKGKKRF